MREGGASLSLVFGSRMSSSQMKSGIFQDLCQFHPIPSVYINYLLCSIFNSTLGSIYPLELKILIETSSLGMTSEIEGARFQVVSVSLVTRLTSYMQGIHLHILSDS